MNFKAKYIADMEQITPDTALLADTRSLLLTPPRRHWGLPAAAILCTAVICTLPFTHLGDSQDEPALLAANGGDIAISTAALPQTESIQADRSAIRNDILELSEAELGGLTEYADLLPQAPIGMAFTNAALSADAAADERTLLVNYTDNGYDYLSLRISPATDDMARTAYSVAEISADLINDCASSSDQGAKYLHITVLSGDYLLEYTAHTADMAAIWQAISAAKIFN